MTPLYLDHNATTPIDPAVREAMLPFLEDEFGNPSSSHRVGKASREAVEKARQQVARLVGCRSDEVVFTSGGTESSNLAILGSFFSRSPVPAGHMIISALEHPATVEPARWLQRCGCSLSVVGCNADGVIAPDDVAAALRDDTVLVSLMHANNEIGTIQPVPAVADLCHRAKVLLHVDAAQSIGKIAVEVPSLGADLVTIAGHKMYAPKGIGALVVRQGVRLAPVLHGANQERGLRPGTENVAQIVGLGKAAELALEHLPSAGPAMARHRDRLEALLREEIGPSMVIHGAEAARLPNTLSVSFPGVTGEALLASLPDFCASTGAACHSGETRVSATLAAMGVSEEVARGTIRLSVGRFTTDQDVERAATKLIEAWRSLSD